jgi:Zn-dependent metalloprotease
MKIFRYDSNIFLALNIFILFGMNMLIGGNQSPVIPGRPPNVPPDVEPLRNYGAYKLNEEQKEFLKSPYLPNIGRIQVTYPRSEGQPFRIRIKSAIKGGLDSAERANSFLCGFSHVIGIKSISDNLKHVDHNVIAGLQDIWIFQQHEQGVPIEGARIILKARPGFNPHSITGIFFRQISIDNRRRLSPDGALRAAIEDLSEEQTAIVNIENKQVLFPYDKGLRWAFRLNIKTKKGPFLIFIDADTGQTLQRTFQLLPTGKPFS